MPQMQSAVSREEVESRVKKAILAKATAEQKVKDTDEAAIAAERELGKANEELDNAQTALMNVMEREARNVTT